MKDSMSYSWWTHWINKGSMRLLIHCTNLSTSKEDSMENDTKVLRPNRRLQIQRFWTDSNLLEWFYYFSVRCWESWQFTMTWFKVSYFWRICATAIKHILRDCVSNDKCKWMMGNLDMNTEREECFLSTLSKSIERRKILYNASQAYKYELTYSRTNIRRSQGNDWRRIWTRV